MKSLATKQWTVQPLVLSARTLKEEAPQHPDVEEAVVGAVGEYFRWRIMTTMFKYSCTLSYLCLV